MCPITQRRASICFVPPSLKMAPQVRFCYLTDRNRKTSMAMRVSQGQSKTQQLKINEAWAAAKLQKTRKLENGMMSGLDLKAVAIQQWIHCGSLWQNWPLRTFNVMIAPVFRGLWWGRRAMCSYQEDRCLVFE